MTLTTWTLSLATEDFKAFWAANALLALLCTMANLGMSAHRSWPRAFRFPWNLMKYLLVLRRQQLQNGISEVRVKWVRKHIGMSCAIGFFVCLSCLVFSWDNDASCATQVLSACLLYVVLTIGRFRPMLITDRTLHSTVAGLVVLQVFTGRVAALHDSVELWTHFVATCCCAVALGFRAGFVLGCLMAISRGHRNDASVPVFLCFQLLLNLVLTHVMVSTARHAARLTSANDAGAALFNLLQARFDGLVELDEDYRVITGSQTFFGMISRTVPHTNQDISTQMLRILPHREVEADSSHLTGSAKNDGHWPAGSSFRDVVRDTADCVALQKTLLEQRMQSEQRQLHPETPCIHHAHATAVHLTLKAKTSNAPLPVRAFCTASYDVELSRFRYFLGICTLEEPPMESACLKEEADEPGAQQEVSFKVDARTPDLTLLTDLCLGSHTLAAGGGLNMVFSDVLFRFVRNYLDDKLHQYQRGHISERVWRYGTIVASAASGATWVDIATLELLSLHPATWAEVCEVKVTITRARQRCAAGGSRSGVLSQSTPVFAKWKAGMPPRLAATDLVLDDNVQRDIEPEPASFDTTHEHPQAFLWAVPGENREGTWSSFWTTPSATQRSPNHSECQLWDTAIADAPWHVVIDMAEDEGHMAETRAAL